MTRLRQSSASSFAARLVDPTRSQNITVIGRRSAETSGPLSGADFDGEAGTFAGGFARTNAAIASSSRSRSPRAETPISLRPASVSRGSRSASILLSRKFASYRPRPRPRSHPPTSMAAPHMAWRDNRPVGSTCPAARSVLLERRDRGWLRSVGRSEGRQGTRFWRNQNQGPLSRALRSFTGPILKGSKGSIWLVRQAVQECPQFACAGRPESTSSDSYPKLNCSGKPAAAGRHVRGPSRWPALSCR